MIDDTELNDAAQKKLNEYVDMMNSRPKPAPTICPHCGYCPHCGKRPDSPWMTWQGHNSNAF